MLNSQYRNHIGPVHPWVRHLWDVMDAPTNAQTTENQRAKQDFNPYIFQLQRLKAVIPRAQRGAIIQKIISWVYLFADHQQTMMIPKLRLVAATIHPRQNAQEFLVKQVSQLIGFSYPTFCQNNRQTGITAAKIRNEQKTAASSPMSKTIVHKIRRVLLMARRMCSRTVHTFLIKFIRLAAIWRLKMKAQMTKNRPGGVTYRQYLAEISLFLVPNRLMKMTAATKNPKLLIRMSQCLGP